LIENLGQAIFPSRGSEYLTESQQVLRTSRTTPAAVTARRIRVHADAGEELGARLRVVPVAGCVELPPRDLVTARLPDCRVLRGDR
jgi:hypothetical protein